MTVGLRIQIHALYIAESGIISACFVYVCFDAGEAWTTEGAGISESQEEGENATGSETKKYNTTGKERSCILIKLCHATRSVAEVF